MDENRIKYLLQRHRANELSEQELAEWNTLIASDEHRELLQQLMEQEVNTLEAAQHFDISPWKPLLAKIISIDQPSVTETATAPVPRMHKWIWAAAAAVIILVSGTWLFIHTKDTETTAPIVNTQREISPATEGAVLTLADGKQVVLDSLGNGTVAMESGTQVILKDGQLHYKQMQQGQKEVQYNTMTTPRGRQFKLTLPDGTDVLLNAESSIRYPVAFNTNERRVELTGEAFFHVKKQQIPSSDGNLEVKVPFVVGLSNNLRVHVLGTQFNVNAYANSETINTTLTEGIVRVYHTDPNAGSAMLVPGQEAIAQAGTGTITVQAADLSKTLAWKNGLFNFENVSLADAMKQLERWYDIDVEYEKDIPDIWFSGKINRNTSLQGLLKILQTTGVQFRVEGKKLVVLQGK